MADFNGGVVEDQQQGVAEDVAMAKRFHEHLEGARKRIELVEVELERTRRVARALESALGQLEAPEKMAPASVYDPNPHL